MAPTAKNGRRTLKSRPSSRKANALGYAKRQSRTVKGNAGLADVYEHRPAKNRRAHVSLALGREEAAEHGARGGSESGDEARGVRPRLVGEAGEGEGLGSDEDEELESDDAFEESDEERFAGFGFGRKASSTSRKAKAKPSGRTAKGVHFADVDLNEADDEEKPIEKAGSAAAAGSDSEEEEEGEPGDFIDLLDILDGRGLPDSGDDESPSQQERSDEVLAEREGEDAEDSDDHGALSEDEDDGAAEDLQDNLAASTSEDEADPAAIESLATFISGLETGTKRKAGEAGVANSTITRQIKKKKLLPERTEAGVESEFGARVSSSTKLSLDDLLAPLSSQSKALADLKKSTKTLTSTSTKNKPLSVPLQQRSQERLDREAAYEQTVQEVDKWNDTIKRIKEAEHLSFPLQRQPAGKTSSADLVAKFQPTTELETAIDRLLKSAKLREEDIAETEALKMNHLSVDEVVARRAELSTMRALMFRKEMKAKRLAKIKSKTYRRMQRISGEKAAAAGGEDDGEDAQQRREVERARERATLRHKNTGKWAKAMHARGEMDVDQRKEINEMLDRGERLRRKIRGEGSDEEDNDDDDDESAEELEGEGGLSQVKAQAFEELAQLQDGDLTQPDPNRKAGKGIFDLKFMRDAAARQGQEVDRMVDDFRKELGDVDVASDDERGLEADDIAPGTVVHRTGGRVSFQPGDHAGLVPQALMPIASQLSDTSTLKSSEPRVSPPAEVPDIREPSTLVATHTTSPPYEPNPWLQHEASSSKVARKRNEVLVGKDSSTAAKSQHTLDKQMMKTTEEKEKERDDAVVEIAAESALVIDKSANTKPRTKKKKDKKRTKVPAAAETGGDGSDSNSEIEEQEKVLAQGGKGVKAFAQRELVARAFAQDQVVLDFADAKRREITADAPRDEDTTLPGWGSWGGFGTKRAPARPHLIKRIAGIKPTTRADFDKPHVIISEKKDKKAAKYMVKDLPYPYTSQAQFERSMETPIGTEWNTRVGFKSGTLPRVTTKMGTVIDPVKRFF